MDINGTADPSQTAQPDPSQMSLPDAAGAAAQAVTPAQPPQAAQPATPAQPAAPGKPSLWRSVVQGALEGLAGSSGSTSFGGGLGRGAAASLAGQKQRADDAANAQAQQQAQMTAQQKAAADIAHTQAMTAQVQQATMNLAAKPQQDVIAARVKQTEDLRKTGAMIPAGDADTSPDHHVALQQVTALTAANPGKLYTAEPITGPDGKVAFQAMQSTDAPLPTDTDLLDINGKKIGVIPKGTPGTQATKLQVAALSQGVADLGVKAKNDTIKANAAMVKAQKTGQGKAAENSAEWKPKVTADEKKKAELAENMTVNAESAAQILKRRPELFGAIGGRFTSTKQMVGSNDPDITAIASEIHNYAMANSGIHGFRSAEGVQRNEQVILNSFKNGPAAVKAALLAGVKSGQTFIDNARPETYKTHSKAGGVIKGMAQ